MAESSDLWDELEQTPLHYLVEQDVLYEINLGEWLGGVENDIDLVLYTRVVCGCDEKWGYPVGHELEEKDE